ncbi:hypothetical protein LuPra_02808 [Luteitalea pratensis]|uniref:Uncharacterized protein n=1 Tax=Luteitalea pratensis TaxID=1855912 RepID=A0A143PP55_LUTPR|nr:hypothetical protein LuPra_02808 [Luteitalea pratensis]
MKSGVHPTYKTHYRVGNWRVYERALVSRGDVTLWLSPAARLMGTPASRLADQNPRVKVPNVRGHSPGARRTLAATCATNRPKGRELLGKC